MSKVKKLFFVKSVGHNTLNGKGSVIACKEWNTLVEEVVEKPTKKDAPHQKKALPRNRLFL